ncbi:AVAST type 1 anti-phage system protease Avs1b [Neorhodopirellula lusitana]|uniref:AVAST type 1 anti-phage system protease Avs1b n=1 Tax=Neorhodopirellula lusitana TaxID=445327 RepID=UPI003850C7C1
MLEQNLKSLICKVECGDERGTGFAFMSGRIFTAWHCVAEAIDGDAEIELTILVENDEEQVLSATVIAANKHLDVCVLEASVVIQTPLGLMAELPREGAGWLSFGYPEGKAIIHRLTGKVATTLQEPKAKSDIDLTVDTETKLDSYKGMSGAPVIVEGACAGILRYKHDGTVAAISGKSLAPILEEIGISKSVVEDELDTRLLAHRNAFQTDFENKVIAGAGKFHFLGGPHGIGKTTFCEHFAPSDPRLLSLGAFCVRDWLGSANTVVRSRPEVLFDWLLSSVSSLITGKADRQKSGTYNEMAEAVRQLLEAFAAHCKQMEKIGILFVDGIDEVADISREQLSNFIGILPTKLPNDIAIVFCSPNFSVIRGGLDGRVGTSNALQIPPLEKDACQQYCFKNLQGELKDLSLVNRICERANGHPLYLNYLIRHLNSHPTDKSLDDFPVLDVDIEEYYERLWIGLSGNENAVNMLAIISRLRQPIEADDFPKVLNEIELASFSTAFTRIQHLFLDDSAVFIYHASFSAFSRIKTANLDEVIEARIASFCRQNSEVAYCVLNRIHHLLRSTSQDNDLAIGECNQVWIDNCVLLHVQPDLLLSDVESVLQQALKAGETVGTIRLLLLSNRLSFRYDTLFAQAAYPIADALISLGNADSVMNHVLRYGHLIVSPEDAISIAFLMARSDEGIHGLRLMDLLEENCIEWLSRTGGMELKEYIYLTSLLVRTLLMKCYIDGEDRLREIIGVQRQAIYEVDSNLGASAPELVKRFVDRISSLPTVHCLSLLDRYLSHEEFKKIPSGGRMTSQQLLDKSVELLLGHIESTDAFSLPKYRESCSALFNDLKSDLLKDMQIEELQIPFVVDALIRLGADRELVELAKKEFEFEELEIKLRDENGVDACNPEAYRAALAWRYRGFIEDDLDFPAPLVLHSENWIERLENLFSMLFFCEGRARRAISENDADKLSESTDYFFDQILAELEFSLLERIGWDRGYAIPETVVPFLAELATDFVIDCIPGSLGRFFDWAHLRSSDQFGIYSEGFRESIFRVANISTRGELESGAKQKLFQLLEVLKTHILDGVENRHELVPALLRLIPLFKKVGAVEVASNLYERVLDYSMGPTWYKEDQFSLLATGLAGLSIATDVSDRLPAYAAVLEIASGEMTFQRYVRNEKAGLIGLLASRQRIDLAIAYFKAQALGEPERLFYQWENSKIDAPEPRLGRGRPGGAIEEQHSILELVRNSTLTDWKLRWALLEIFQFGDFRHVRDYGSEYAKLANENLGDDDTLAEIQFRMKLLIDSEVPEAKRKEFFDAFSSQLDDGIKAVFIVLESFCQAPSDEDMFRPPTAAREPSERDREEFDDKFYMPGTFGKRSALKDAKVMLAEARDELDLGNISKMKSKLVAAVQNVQDGGWPVWQGSSEVMQIAECAIKENSETPAEFIQAFESIVLSERHAASWAIADHILTVLSDVLDEQTKLDVFDSIFDHVKLMVGEPDAEIGQFEFLGNPQAEEVDNDELLFDFILWFANHPNWVRREKAAQLALWLSRSDSKYISSAIKQAFKGDVGFPADVACGILEIHSVEKPDELWSYVETTIDTKTVPETLSHVCRLATLLRLADRSSHSSENVAKNVKSKIEELTLDGTILIPEVEGIELPKWAICVEEEWRKLEVLGVVTGGLLADVESCLKSACEPYSISEIHDLEDKVSTTFRGPNRWPLNRWKAKVHFALSKALIGYVSSTKLNDIEEAIRIFNPNAPCERRTPFFSSRYHQIKEEFQKTNSFFGVVGDETRYHLHYFELAEDESAESSRTYMAELEITAVAVSADLTRRGYFTPEISPAFDSRQWANQYPPFQDHEVVRAVSPGIVFLGSLTPALPSSTFLDLAQCNAGDFERRTWRSGRSRAFDFEGRPICEGSCLSIPKKMVKMPKDKKLAWIVKLNNRIVAMVDEIGNELI